MHLFLPLLLRLFQPTIQRLGTHNRLQLMRTPWCSPTDWSKKKGFLLLICWVSTGIFLRREWLAKHNTHLQPIVKVQKPSNQPTPLEMEVTLGPTVFHLTFAAPCPPPHQVRGTSLLPSILALCCVRIYGRTHLCSYYITSKLHLLAPSSTPILNASPNCWCWGCCFPELLLIFVTIFYSCKWWNQTSWSDCNIIQWPCINL